MNYICGSAPNCMAFRDDDDDADAESFVCVYMLCAGVSPGLV